MNLKDAYRLGQEDMKRRIAKEWSGWITNTLGGHGGLSGGKVSVLIRKVRPHSLGDVPMPIDTQQWQPIETAPKGQGDILVYSSFEIRVCWWNGSGWQYELDTDEHYGDTMNCPTHWMPLPAPPTT